MTSPGPLAPQQLTPSPSYSPKSARILPRLLSLAYPLLTRALPPFSRSFWARFSARTKTNEITLWAWFPVWWLAGWAGWAGWATVYIHSRHSATKWKRGPANCQLSRFTADRNVPWCRRHCGTKQSHVETWNHSLGSEWASKGTNGRASGPVLTSGYLVDLVHCATWELLE